MQGVYEKLGPGLPCQKQRSARSIFHQQIRLRAMEETSEVLHLEYGVETRTLRKLDQKYLECFEMWRRRRREKISWADRVNNEAVLHRVTEGRNILHTIIRRKANWTGHILRTAF
jgi:hypothetical protein